MKLELLKSAIGLGVAGNFAKHLEQAGEIKDFLNVKVEEESAPKGIFPFYLPNDDSFLNTFPISDTQIVLPEYEANAQVEPEVAIFFEIVYENNKVLDLNPISFCAFNDCTIRKDGAKKISEKKNWGNASKGIGDKWIAIDKFSIGGVMDDYKLASFVTRDGVLYPYGEDSPLLGYSYFYEKLKKWLIDKMNNQKDFGPLEDIAKLLQENNYPKNTIITIGATAYMEFGEKNYLQENDEISVVVYNKNKDINDNKSSQTKSILNQIVKRS